MGYAETEKINIALGDYEQLMSDIGFMAEDCLRGGFSRQDAASQLYEILITMRRISPRHRENPYNVLNPTAKEEA